MLGHLNLENRIRNMSAYISPYVRMNHRGIQLNICHVIGNCVKSKIYLKVVSG
jgi:hypothetical protein